jgi:hypothetical protein
VRLAPLLALACLALTSCGAERRPPPDPARALGSSPATREVELARAGVTLRVPVRVALERRRPPALFRLSLPSGAVVSSFAYRRDEPLPRDGASLRAARRRLERAVRRRDPGFRLISSRVLRAGGAAGVEIVGRQMLSGGRLDTRSVHLFEGNAEYVFELLAPRPDFAPADRLVFSPMLRSLSLTGRVQG